jgi:predicted GH43/DUF377 family glycosyl hydrolase
MTIDPPKEPDYVLHNRALTNQVLRDNKYYSRFPPVSEQVELLPLQYDKLYAGGYNPTINDKGWMVYRFHKGLPSTKLARAILDKEGNVFSNHELVIGDGLIGEDDPKLFTFGGEDHISWVESLWAGERPSSCVVKYAKFVNGQLSDFEQPDLPQNDHTGFCKNLVFFEYGSHLCVVYQCHPTHRIYNLTSGNIHETESPKWIFGPIRGGTKPLLYNGQLLRFFHSRLDNEFAPVRFRYFIGAYLMENKPPFKVVRVSRKPILYGSEVSDLKRTDRPYHYKPNVVFVSGALPRSDGWELSVGENDSRCLLCKVTPEQLNF